MLVRASRRPDPPPSTRWARGGRRLLEEDERLAARLAIEEIRALDIYNGDRALAIRLQEEEQRFVTNTL